MQPQRPPSGGPEPVEEDGVRQMGNIQHSHLCRYHQTPCLLIPGQGSWPLPCDLQQFEFQESLKLSARAQEGRAPSYGMEMMRNAPSAQNSVQKWNHNLPPLCAKRVRTITCFLSVVQLLSELQTVCKSQWVANCSEHKHHWAHLNLHRQAEKSRKTEKQRRCIFIHSCLLFDSECELHIACCCFQCMCLTLSMSSKTPNTEAEYYRILLSRSPEFKTLLGKTTRCIIPITGNILNRQL